MVNVYHSSDVFPTLRMVKLMGITLRYNFGDYFLYIGFYSLDKRFHTIGIHPRTNNDYILIDDTKYFYEDIVKDLEKFKLKIQNNLAADCLENLP